MNDRHVYVYWVIESGSVVHHVFLSEQIKMRWDEIVWEFPIRCRLLLARLVVSVFRVSPLPDDPTQLNSTISEFV